MAVVPWNPLVGGRCAYSWGTKTARNAIDEVSPMVWGKTDDVDKIVVDNLEQVAKELGYSMAQTSLAWMLSKPFTKVIFQLISRARQKNSSGMKYLPLMRESK